MKGQWFLISAVLATSAFLSISLVLKDYFVTDASDIARGREDYYLWDLRTQFDALVQESSCDDMEKNLNGFIAFVRNRLWESGYLGYIEYDKTQGKTQSYAYDCEEDDPVTPPNERVRNIEKGLLVATEDAVFYSNIDPDDVIK
ncbi:MAG: hypothetical protein HY514_00020 [Candidatus Aenigmarchaeota archaeon]|nr:hypothetical protein [Candidatus Aenigmarchaeota archaeon]